MPRTPERTGAKYPERRACVRQADCSCQQPYGAAVLQDLVGEGMQGRIRVTGVELGDDHYTLPPLLFVALPSVLGPLLRSLLLSHGAPTPKGRRRSLRDIARELATLGYVNKRGAPNLASCVKSMLGHRALAPNAVIEQEPTDGALMAVDGTLPSEAETRDGGL